MLTPTNTGVVPPGGYCRYRDPDTGTLIEHPYYDQVKNKARSHRAANNLPIPWDWDQWFDRYFCESTPAACYESREAVETAPSFLTLAKNFTNSMVNWARSGFATVDYETFKERYVQCSGDVHRPRCPKFSHFSGTGLSKCGKCGCSSLKLWLEREKCPLGKW